MKRIIASLLSLSIAATAFAGVGGDKVAYRGGTISTVKQDFEAKPVFTDPAVFKFGPATIPYSGIQSIEYGQKAGRRIGAAVAVTILVTPLGLLMLMSKKRKHIVSLTWSADGKTEAAVLEFGKGSIRQALKVFAARSGKTVEFESEDAKKNLGQ